MRKDTCHGLRFMLSFFLILCSTITIGAKDEDALFFTLGNDNGLLDNNVLQMMQLPDGGMALMTGKGISIYEDRRFRNLPIDNKVYSPIPGYKGHVHLYVDDEDRFWIKDRGKVWCTRLGKLGWIKNPLKDSGDVTDFFVDSQRHIWFVRDKEIASDTGNDILWVEDSLGEIQDIDADEGSVFVFYSCGAVMVFNRENDKLVSTVHAYSSQESKKYDQTSLAIRTGDGQFYQIRTGSGGSVFLHFNPKTSRYEKLYSCDYTLHTLNMASDHEALISSEHGYLMFDLNISTTPREITELSLPDGKSLVTGINTVCRDRDGGIWLGTYHNGIIYVSPYLGLFFKAEKPWWKQTKTILFFVAVVVLLIVLAVFYVHRKRQVYKNAAILADDVASQSVKALTEQQEEEKVDEPEFLQNARQIIIAHLSDSSFGVEQLAAELYMERTGLYKKITTLANETPVNFIRNIRLDKAAELLSQGKASVSDVAEKTGFASPGYFTKCFKARFGMKPSEYKR